MTLKRVLEPEVMDTIQEAQDYDAMDHGEVNRRFVADLLEFLPADPLPDDAETLDLGTGTAQIPVELCLRRGDCRVVAVDLATNMLDLAVYNIEVAGVVDRIMLQHVDAKRLPFQDGRFLCVMSNSIVHHIPEPIVALREAVRVLAAGGWIFFRDLLRPANDAKVAQLVTTYAGQENAFQRQLFEQSLRAALDLDEIRDLIRQLGFSADTVRSTSDRHWTWAAQKAHS
jgi:ubiquinone/menaquinone biosynthesis C-methylase UbiE